MNSRARFFYNLHVLERSFVNYDSFVHCSSLKTEFAGQIFIQSFLSEFLGEILAFIAYSYQGPLKFGSKRGAKSFLLSDCSVYIVD